MENFVRLTKDDNFVLHFVDYCDQTGFDPRERIQFLAAQDWTPTKPTTKEELAVINQALRKLPPDSSFEVMTEAIRSAMATRAAKSRRTRRSASAKRAYGQS